MTRTRFAGMAPAGWALLLLMVGLVSGALVPVAHAQYLPGLYEPMRTYREGLLLFDHEKYNAAEAKFREFEALSAHWTRHPEAHVLQADAAYYGALCSYHLLRSDAESRLEAFAVDYPESEKVPLAYYYLGKLLFIKRNYQRAQPFLAQVSADQLDAEASDDARFMRGYCAYHAGDLAQAAQLLAPLGQRLGPLHDPANYYYGVVQFDLGIYTEALKAFEAVAQSPQYGPKSPVYIAQCLLRLGRYEDLETYGAALLKNDVAVEQEGEIYQIIGEGLFAKGRWKEAAQFLEESLQKVQSPSRAVRYRLGYSLYELKNYKGALSAFNAITFGTDTLAQAGSYFSAYCHANLGNREDARLLFKKTYDVGINPEFSEDALFQYAKLSFETNYYAEALNAFKTYVAAYPQSPHKQQANALIGEVLYYSNNFEESIKFFESGDLSDPRANTAYQKACFFYGLSFFQRNLLPDAKLYFKKAIDRKADANLTATAQFWLAETIYYQQDYLGASQAYNAYLNLPGAAKNEFYAEALVGLGWSHLLQDNYTSALPRFTTVISLPDIQQKKPRTYIEACLRAGDVNFIQKKYNDAMKLYQRVVTFGKQEADYARFRVGLSQYRMQQYEPAVASLRDLVTQHRTSGWRDDALDLMAEICLEWIKDYGRADQYDRQLIAEHPGSPLLTQAYKRLAKTALRDDRPQEALTFLKVALFEYGDGEALAQLDYMSKLKHITAAEYESLKNQFLAKYPENDQLQAQLLFKEARKAFDGEDYPQAIALLTQLTSKFPNTEYFHEALLLRGLTRELQGDTAAALADYRRVYDSKTSGDAGARALLQGGALAYAQRDYLTAGELYQQAATRAAARADVERAKFGQAAVLMAKGQYADADNLLNQLLGDATSTAATKKLARIQLGQSQLSRKNYAAARSAFEILVSASEKAGERDRFWAEAQYRVVVTWYLEKNYDKVRETGTHLRTQSPQYSEWQARSEYLVAASYVAQSRRTEAEQVLKNLAANAFVEVYIPELQVQAQELLAQLPQDPLPTPSLPWESSAPAQPSDLDMITDFAESTVTKSRTEGLPTKVKFTIAVPQPALEVPTDRLSYSPAVQDFKPPLPPITTTVLPVPKPQWPALYPYHLRAGLGRWLTPELGLYIGNTRHSRLEWALETHHLSTARGHVDNARFGDTRVGLKGRYLLDKHTIYSQLNFQHYKYRYYGDSMVVRELRPDDSIRAHFNRLNLQLGISRNFESQKFLYDIGLRLQTYGDRWGRRETHIGLLPRFDWMLNESWTVRLDLEGTVSNVNYIDTLSSHQQLYWGFAPRVEYRRGQLTADIGLGVRGLQGYLAPELQTDTAGITRPLLESQSRVGVYPILRLNYNLAPGKHSVFLDLKGDLHYTRLYDLSVLNPWTTPNLLPQPAYEPIHLAAGLRGHLGPVNYEVRGWFRSVLDQPVFVSPTFDAQDSLPITEPFLRGAGYHGLVADNLRETGASLQLSYDPKAKGRAGMLLSYRGYQLDSLEAFYGMPNLQAEVWGGYNFSQKFSVLTRIYFIGERTLTHSYNPLGEATAITAKPFIDLGLELEYRISPRFSIWATAANLLGNDYYRWYGYLERPLDFRLGGSVSLK